MTWLHELRARQLLAETHARHLAQQAREARDTALTRWETLDPQKKQLLLVGAFYVMLSLLDLATGVAKHRLTRSTG